MKKILFILILFIFCCSIYAENLTNEQAIQIVKNFENNQNLSGFEVTYTENNQVCDVSLNDKKWTIENNKVCMYINFNETNATMPTNENVNYSIQQCKNIAINYLNDKNISLLEYSEIPIYNWNLGCHSFCFFQIIDSQLNLMSKNQINIFVNGFTGNISFLGINNNNPTFTVVNRPNLTNEQIIEIIQNNFENITASSIMISEYLINDTNDSIVKVVSVGNIGEAIIDAYSHEITDFHAYGGNYKPKKPIKTINKNSANNIILQSTNNTYVDQKSISNNFINLILCDIENPKDVKYTVIPTGFEIDKEDKGIARMEVNGKKFIFRKGSYWCFINNKTYNMDGNCIIKDGKLQLPEDFYKKVQTKDYDFFPKNQNSITK